MRRVAGGPLWLLLAAAVIPPGAARGADAAAILRDYQDTLREAQAGIDRLLMAYPGRADLGSVKRQLDQVAEWTRGGRRPSSAQVKWLSIGVIAAREIEPLDLRLARQLQALAHFLAHWPGGARR